MDLSTIGRQFGLSDEQTRSALDALVPVVAAGVRRNAQTPDGLQDIFRSVLTGGAGNGLDDDNEIAFERAKPRGDDILGKAFGSKDVSREVAQQLSATSGIGAAVLKKLMPIVASIVMAQVAKRMGAGNSSGGGGLGDILGDILGGGQKQQQAPTGGSGGGLGDILKDILGGGQAAPAPRQPAPSGQGSGNPLEDILGDILGGGRGTAQPVPQDQMGDILKDIFGGNVPGGSPAPTGKGAERGRKTLDDMLGRGTSSGNAAEDMLNSVEDSIRRRR